VGDLDPGATGKAGVRVGDAVNATDGSVLFGADARVFALTSVGDLNTGAAGLAGIAVGLSVDAANGSVLGGADAVVLALAAVLDGDTGAAGLACVTVGVAVDAANRLPLVGAATCLGLAHAVTDGGAGGVGIIITGAQADVRTTIMIRRAVVVAQTQGRLSAVTGLAAVRVDDIPVGAGFHAQDQRTFTVTLTLVGDQGVSAVSLAAVPVGLSVEAAYGCINLGAHAHVVIFGARALDTDLALGAVRIDAAWFVRKAVVVAHKDDRTDRDPDEFYCFGRQGHCQSPLSNAPKRVGPTIRWLLVVCKGWARVAWIWEA